MTKKSQRERILEEFKRKQIDRREKQHLENSKDFRPEHPDNR